MDFSGLKWIFFGDGTTAYAHPSDYLEITYQQGTSCANPYAPSASTSVQIVNWEIATDGTKSCLGLWYVLDKVYTYTEDDGEGGTDTVSVVDNDTIPMIPCEIHTIDICTAVVDSTVHEGGTDCFICQAGADTSCGAGYVPQERGDSHNSLVLAWDNSGNNCRWYIAFGSVHFLGPHTPNDPRGTYVLDQPDRPAGQRCPAGYDCNSDTGGTPCLVGTITVS
jgi:hypothetical protein